MLNAPRSPWLPLICNFPTTYHDLPWTWSDRLLHAAAPELREHVDASFSVWSAFLFNEVAHVNFRFQGIVPGGLPAKYILWATFAVLSRAFEQHGGAALIPVADLLNHDHDRHVAVQMYVSSYDEAAVPHSFVVTLLRDLKAGDEMFFFYGSHCSLKWLTTYGFVPRVVDAQCQ